MRVCTRDLGLREERDLKNKETQREKHIIKKKKQVQSKFLLNNDVEMYYRKRMPRLFSAACVCMVARKERQYIHHK